MEDEVKFNDNISNLSLDTNYINNVEINVKLKDIKNIFLETFVTQLIDWTSMTEIIVKESYNVSIIIYQTMFIIELIIKTLLIKKFGIVNYDQEITNTNFKILVDSNCFKLSHIGHQIQLTLDKIIENNEILTNIELESVKKIHKYVENIFLNVPNFNPNKYNHLRYNYYDKKIINECNIELIKEISMEVIEIVKLQRTN